MRILVEELRQTPVDELEVEVVERKGLGHPDFIADSSCEAVSQTLCRYYKEQFGTILHHNVDKGLVVGGRARPRFGGGEVLEPIRIIIAGRATTEVARCGKVEKVDVESIAYDAVREWLRASFRYLDVDSHVEIQPMIRMGSADLISVFERAKEVPLANDTSFGVCFAPLTETEQLTLETERFLNSPRFKSSLPEVGEDVKVLCVRRKGEVDMTISTAIISSLTHDVSHYLSVKEQVAEQVADLASRLTDMPVSIVVNAADNPDPKSEADVYLTVTGTSAEAGDDGNTGRSNRVNGLITPCRQMSLEATAGKNPVNHVGKIYNVLTKLIADRVYGEIRGVREAYVKVVSQIGKPINQPLVTSVQVVLERSFELEGVKPRVQSIVEDEVANVVEITERVLQGEVTLF